MLELRDANKRVLVNTCSIGGNRNDDLEPCYNLVDVSTGEIVYQGSYNACAEIGFIIKRYVQMPLWIWQ